MKNTYYVDDITYNDLELDEIFKLLDHTKSTAGSCRLMYRLRNPYIKSCSEYIDFLRLSDEIYDDRAGINDKLSKHLEEIGQLKGSEYLESLDKICSGDKDSNLKHWLYIVFVLISFALIFISPGFGLVLFFVAIGVSVTSYFKYKNILSDKLTVFSYIIRMLKSVGKINAASSDKSGGALEYVTVKKVDELHTIYDTFKPFMSFAFFIQPGVSTSGNIVSIALDYVRIIFHADIIKYNSMIMFLTEHKDEAVKLYEIIGDLDTALSIAAFKKEFTGDANGNSGVSGRRLCKPIITKRSDEFILKGAYHPLIENPVDNSIEVSRNVLLTGSNASGKSTYLKTVAINAILAQSFFFAFAEEFEAGSMRVYTSMALRDSIKNSESYFMAEIKSLKRIFDAGKNESAKDVNSGDAGGTASDDVFDKDARILCIIDEVLRGTNTVERIAASVEILKALCNDNFLCFAATHDIELTELLSDSFDNYSFSETYVDGDIKFDYKLRKGAADSRNAIKLLNILGFEDGIVKAAEKRVEKYLETGSF